MRCRCMWLSGGCSECKWRQIGVVVVVVVVISTGRRRRGVHRVPAASRTAREDRATSHGRVVIRRAALASPPLRHAASTSLPAHARPPVPLGGPAAVPEMLVSTPDAILVSVNIAAHASRDSRIFSNFDRIPGFFFGTFPGLQKFGR